MVKAAVQAVAVVTTTELAALVIRLPLHHHKETMVLYTHLMQAMAQAAVALARLDRQILLTMVAQVAQAQHPRSLAHL
jgi:hypothetical protein